MIAKKLAGENSELEDQVFINWLNASPENKEMFREQEEIWKIESHHQKIEKEERLFGAVRDQLEQDNTFTSPPGRSYVFRYAAVIGLLIASIAAVLTFDNIVRDESKVVLVEKVSPQGQKSRIHLPDGSVVMLNAGSTLKYPAEFSDHSRELVLVGEGYFEVAKDKVRPFIVTSSGVSTTALGTAFNVRAYPDEDRVEVSLTEGEVKVETGQLDTAPQYLLPGQQVKVNKEDMEVVRATFSDLEVISWKDGTIYFQDASMENVFKVLERWYDVEFSIEGTPSLPWEYSGEFQHEYLSNVLHSIGYSQDFEFEIDGKKVIVKF